MRILPLAKPIISYSPSIDHFLSVLNLYSAKTLPWIIENYIEVVFNPTSGENFFMAEFLDIYKFWWNCPFINVSRMERVLLEDEDIIFVAKNAIEKNAYVMMVIDTYYISGYRTYQKHHAPHEIFLYGYNEDGFYTSDYFNFSQCTNRIIPFGQFLDAYKHFSNKEKDYLCGVVFFHPNLDVIENGRDDLQFQVHEGRKVYISDRQLIKQKLKGFLDSSPLVLASYPNEFDPCFGFRTGYDAFDEIAKEISTDTIARLKKPFCLLHAHIQLMTIRIGYLQECFHLELESLHSRCLELEQRCLMMKNRYLKDSMLQKNDAGRLREAVRELLLQYEQLIKNFEQIL